MGARSWVSAACVLGGNLLRFPATGFRRVLVQPFRGCERALPLGVRQRLAVLVLLKFDGPHFGVTLNFSCCQAIFHHRQAIQCLAVCGLRCEDLFFRGNHSVCALKGGALDQNSPFFSISRVSHKFPWAESCTLAEGSRPSERTPRRISGGGFIIVGNSGIKLAAVP
jgi:hypothetical protein